MTRRESVPERNRATRARDMLLTAALAAAGMAPAPTAHAQNATWLANPGSNDFATASNWSPATVPTGTAFFGTSNTTSLTFSTSTTVGGWTFNAGASNYTFTIPSPQTVSFNGAGIINNGGSATINNDFVLQFFGTSTAGSATINNNSIFGSVGFNNSSTAGSATINNNGTLFFQDTSTAGSATINNNSTGFSVVEFGGSSSAGSATIINNDEITFLNSGTAGSANITNNSETNFIQSSTAGNATINNNGLIFFEDTSTGGMARLINGALGGIDLSNLASAGTTAGSIEGAGTISLGGKNLTVGGNNLSTTFSGVIGDGGLFGGTGGSLTKVGTGTLALTGANVYTGATTINGGTLEVDGSIATSSLTTVNASGTLSGIGTVGATQINAGGTFAPGNAASTSAMTVSGNLAFASGATYQVQVNPTAASSANVTGTASLAGTVNAVFAPGSYVTNRYTILQSAGLNGTTFAGLSNTNLPEHANDTLSYSGGNVFLNLSAAMPTGGLNQNQQTISNTLNNFFNSGGALPPGFASLFNLTGANLASALTHIDGEDATGAERGAFDLMNEFLNLMLDPYVDGPIGGGGGGPLGFAPDRQGNLPPDIALAYAGLLKAPPQRAFAQPWTAWGSAFGGSATTNGDASVGSNNVTTGTFGYAAGMDYHVSPDTVLGFALAGGGTSWTLAQGLGTGRSDAFLVGIHGVTRRGPVYLAGALAFANNWFTTNRTALGDQLTASFQGQSYAARLEGGYRFAIPAAHDAIGITPYAAIQAQNFHTPSYGETDPTAGGFGLTYAAMSGTDTRSELGGRFDDLTAFNAMPLILRARLAWAHDWVGNPALNAAFEALPGTGFTVNGAPIPHGSALTSAGAQLFFRPNWSLLAKFDGEFASGSQTYAGSGTLRYTW